LLFSDSKVVNDRIIKFVKDQQVSPSAGQGAILADERLILERLFQKLEHTDNAAAEKLERDFSGVGARSDVMDWRVFCDPLIPWRYATFMYKNREYLGALKEAQIGLQLWGKLRPSSSTTDDEEPYRIPERILFSRRIVEYALCHEMTQLRYNVASVAGMSEGYNLIAARASEWIHELDRVHRGSNDPAESARALCYQLLIGLCVTLAMAFQGRPRTTSDLEPYLGKFRELENSNIDSSTRIKTWWLVCKAAAHPSDRMGHLMSFRDRIGFVRHHPPEKMRFEELCGNLLEMWPEDASAPTAEFTSRALDMLQAEIRAMQSVAAIAADVKRMLDVLGTQKRSTNGQAHLGMIKGRAGGRSFEMRLSADPRRFWLTQSPLACEHYSAFERALWSPTRIGLRTT
jgi:hypothetical protein